jgi:hypothetical protein
MYREDTVVGAVLDGAAVHYASDRHLKHPEQVLRSCSNQGEI